MPPSHHKGFRMLIALEDPIWTRLYRPYGVQDVAGILEDLSRRWDEDTARDLYREKLHHQDDLYPVTFAALPWVWRIAPRPLTFSAETPLFLSHVLDCALRPGDTGPRGDEPRGRYRGLVLDAGAHQWSWLPVEKRLRAEDMPILERLEGWFTQAVPEFAEACLNLVSSEEPHLGANLLRGLAALKGAFTLPFALSLWGDQQNMRIIAELARPETAEDRSAAVTLAAQIAARCPDLAKFLKEWAAA